MLRRLFTLSSALSLLLAVAVAVLWVRSYWRADGLNVDFGREVETEFVTVRGNVVFSVEYDTDNVEGRTYMYGGPVDQAVQSLFTPTNWVLLHRYTALHIYKFQIADWIAVLLLSLMPTTWLWSRWRARRDGKHGFTVLPPDSARPHQP